MKLKCQQKKKSDAKPGRGGARKGAGRPKTSRTETIYVRISAEALQHLNKQTYNRSEYIDNLLLADKKRDL